MARVEIFGTFLVVWFFTDLALSYRPYRFYISKPHIALAATYFLCGILAAVIWIQKSIIEYIAILPLIQLPDFVVKRLGKVAS